MCFTCVHEMCVQLINDTRQRHYTSLIGCHVHHNYWSDFQSQCQRHAIHDTNHGPLEWHPVLVFPVTLPESQCQRHAIHDISHMQLIQELQMFLSVQTCSSDVPFRTLVRKALCKWTYFRTTTATTVLRPLFQDHPGELVPEENFWTLWCKGRLTEADTLTIQLGATPSTLTSAYRCPSCRPTNSVKALKATSAFGLGRRR